MKTDVMHEEAVNLGGLQYTMYPSTDRGSSLAVNDRTMDVQLMSDRPITP